MAGAGVRCRTDLRGGRRQGRGAGRGLRLHAGGQSALDDPEMDVRHPRGRRARQCREGAARGRAARRAAVAQRLRLRPQACRACRRHRRDPDRRIRTTRFPSSTQVGKTLLVASGSHGKFLSRLDLDVQGGAVRDFRYRLIPLFADVIDARRRDARRDRAGARAVRSPSSRARSDAPRSCSIAAATSTARFDDLICAALIEERDAEIALSPGFRWGTSMLPGSRDHRRGHPQRDRDHLSERLPACR